MTESLIVASEIYTGGLLLAFSRYGELYVQSDVSELVSFKVY